jgi:hypothetical protein
MADSGLHCLTSSAMDSAPMLISCRYQLRENRRSLRFCAALAAVLSVLALSTWLAQALLGIPGGNKGGGRAQKLLASMHNAGAQRLILSELPDLLPMLLALLCTLLVHVSSLLLDR